MPKLRLALPFPGIVWALTACAVATEVESTTEIACGASRDCPNEMTCNPNTLRCVAGDDPDLTAPAVLPPVLLTPTLGDAETQFTLHLTVSEPLPSPPEVYFEDLGVRRAFAFVGGDATELDYAYNPDGTESELDHPLRVEMTDAAGNPFAGQLGVTITFDFTAPVISSLQWTLAPPPGSQLRAADALLGGGLIDGLAVAGDGSPLSTVVVLDAPLDPATQLAVEVVDADTGEAARALAFVAQSGSRYVYETVLGAGLSVSVYAVRATATDAAGNQASRTTSGLFDLDRTPPAALDLEAEGTVWFERSPYGTQGVPEPFFAVRGAPGAAEPGALVLALGPDGLVGPLLGVGSVDALDGSFFVRLPPEDRRSVDVVVMDRAGNAQPPARVRQVRWTVTLAGKRPGVAVDNPNVFLDTVSLADLRLPGLALERGEDDGVAGLSCTGSCRQNVLRTSGTGYWRDRLPATPWPTPPDTFAPLRRMAAAYDPISQQVLVFGGWSTSGTTSSETWTFDGERWILAGSGGPEPRFGARMAYDANAGRVLLFGGQQFNTDPACTGRSANYSCPDLWSWSGGAGWQAVTLSGTVPTARSSAGMVFDPTRDRMVIYGGHDGTTLFNDTFELNCTSATACSSARYTAGAPTSGRTLAGMTYDLANQRVVLHGGATGPCFGSCTVLDELWVRPSSGTSWSALSLEGRLARAGHSLVAIPARQAIGTFGWGDWGAPATTPRCAGPWGLTGAGWQCGLEVAVEGTGVGEQEGTVAVHDPERDQVLVFGTDFDGWTHLWATGVDERPAHVLEVAFGAAFGGKPPVVARVNFQPAGAETPVGFVADDGSDFGDRADGRRFGWSCGCFYGVCPPPNRAVDHNFPAPSQAHDTSVAMQFDESPTTKTPAFTCTWEYELPNGRYHVRVLLGSSGPELDGQRSYAVLVEGEPVSGTATDRDRFLEVDVTVDVADGMLTLANDNSVGTYSNTIAALSIVADTRIDGLELQWRAGAESTANGAVLLAWDGQDWAVLDTDPAATPGALQTLGWIAPPTERTLYLHGEERQLTFAVAPLGVNGDRPAFATIATDVVFAVIDYRVD